ncbi:MAG: hypothetical protein WCG26_03725 [Chloroflexales bacterium]
MADNEMPDDREPTDTTGEPSLRAAAAFDAYYAMGPMRSLRKLAAQGLYSLASLERWSSSHDWQREARARHQEEVTAARDAARKEAATLARRRLRNAQLLQEAGLTIMARAQIAEMDEESARKGLGDARQMMVEGMRAERLELGEATETIQAIPPAQPVGQLSDAELDAYIALLDAADER